MSEYNFSAQYQQNPIPLKGNIINFDDFKYFEKLPATNNRIIVQSWDCANKTGDNNDFSACVTAVIVNDIVYICDIVKNKLEYPELLDAMKYMQNIAKSSLIIIEEANIGSGIIQELNAEGFEPIPFKPDVAKTVRATFITKLIRDGKVRLMKAADWLGDFSKEIRTFPFGAHDDQVDALVQLLTWVQDNIFDDFSAECIVDGTCYYCDDCNDFSDYQDEVNNLKNWVIDDAYNNHNIKQNNNDDKNNNDDENNNDYINNQN